MLETFGAISILSTKTRIKGRHCFVGDSNGLLPEYECFMIELLSTSWFYLVVGTGQRVTASAPVAVCNICRHQITIPKQQWNLLHPT